MKQYNIHCETICILRLKYFGFSFFGTMAGILDVGGEDSAWQSSHKWFLSESAHPLSHHKTQSVHVDSLKTLPSFLRPIQSLPLSFLPLSYLKSCIIKLTIANEGSASCQPF